MWVKSQYVITAVEWNTSHVVSGIARAHVYSGINHSQTLPLRIRVNGTGTVRSRVKLTVNIRYREQKSSSSSLTFTSARVRVTWTHALQSGWDAFIRYLHYAYFEHFCFLRFLYFTNANSLYTFFFHCVVNLLWFLVLRFLLLDLWSWPFFISVMSKFLYTKGAYKVIRKQMNSHFDPILQYENVNINMTHITAKYKRNTKFDVTSAKHYIYSD